VPLVRGPEPVQGGDQEWRRSGEMETAMRRQGLATVLLAAALTMASCGGDEAVVPGVTATAGDPAADPGRCHDHDHPRGHDGGTDDDGGAGERGPHLGRIGAAA